MEKWYMLKGGQKYGPYSMEQLKSFAKSGHLSKNDALWKDGMAEWIPAQNIGGVFSSSVGTVLAITIPIGLLAVVGVVLVLLGVFSGSTRYTDVKAASNIHWDTYAPMAVTEQFDASIQSIYVTAKISGVKEGTSVSAIWIHKETGEQVYRTGGMPVNDDGWIPFIYYNPGNGFLPGEYVVELLIDDQVKDTISFRIVSSIQSDQDTDFRILDWKTYIMQQPEDEWTESEAMISTWTYAILFHMDIQNSQVGHLTAHWIWLEEDYLIDKFTIELQADHNECHFFMNRPDNGWPDGQYAVEFEYNDEIVDVAFFSVVSGLYDSDNGDEANGDDVSYDYNRVFEVLVGKEKLNETVTLSLDAYPITGGYMDHHQILNENVYGSYSETQQSLVFDVLTTSSIQETYDWLAQEIQTKGWTVIDSFIDLDSEYPRFNLLISGAGQNEGRYAMILCSQWWISEDIVLVMYRLVLP